MDFVVHLDQPTPAKKLAMALAAAAGQVHVDPTLPEVAAAIDGAVFLAEHLGTDVRVSMYRQGSNLSISVSGVNDA